ncbi:MAG: hypothetical protein ACRD0L_04250 [Acidimicrobiales bacterium]
MTFSASSSSLSTSASAFGLAAIAAHGAWRLRLSMQPVSMDAGRPGVELCVSALVLLVPAPVLVMVWGGSGVAIGAPLVNGILLDEP